MKKNKRLLIPLSEAQHRQIKMMAVRRDVTMQEIVAGVIKDFLDKKELRRPYED